MDKIEELESKINDLAKELEAFKKKQGNESFEKWNDLKMITGETYWSVDRYGNIYENDFDGEAVDENIFKHRIHYRTKEECQKWIEINNDFYEASFEPNWKDNKQYKYFINYDCRVEECYAGYTYNYHCGEKYFFENGDICNELIDRFGHHDIAKYVLGVNL